MRTTVDLPPAVHQRARELARTRHQSLSTVIADLTSRGLASLGDPLEIGTDPRSGLPTITLGTSLSSEQVAEMLDEE